MFKPALVMRYQNKKKVKIPVKLCDLGPLRRPSASVSSSVSPDCCVDLAKWCTEGPGAAGGVSHDISLLLGLSLLLAVCQLQLLTLSELLPINGNCHVSMNVTLPASWPSVCKFPVTHRGPSMRAVLFHPVSQSLLPFQNRLS